MYRCDYRSNDFLFGNFKKTTRKKDATFFLKSEIQSEGKTPTLFNVTAWYRT